LRILRSSSFLEVVPILFKFAMFWILKLEIRIGLKKLNFFIMCGAEFRPKLGFFCVNVLIRILDPDFDSFS
jgi:hypothetical protein